MKFWNKPARQEKKIREEDFVADLDALDSRPVYFRFLGRMFKIPPISTGQLLNVYAGFMKVDMLAKSNAIDADKLIDTYTELFSSMCPEITREIVSKMTQAQAAALYTLIFETVSGRIGASKKKLDLMNQMQAETQAG